jgi:hypothetical protein
VQLALVSVVAPAQLQLHWDPDLLQLLVLALLQDARLLLLQQLLMLRAGLILRHDPAARGCVWGLPLHARPWQHMALLLATALC